MVPQADQSGHSGPDPQMGASHRCVSGRLGRQADEDPVGYLQDRGRAYLVESRTSQETPALPGVHRGA